MARIGSGRGVRRIGERSSEVVLRCEAAAGAGAVWDDRTATMLWVDQAPGRIHRLDPRDHADVVVVRTDHRLVGAAPFASGAGFVIAAPDHVGRIGADGSVRRRLGLPGGARGDVVTAAACDRSGRFWVGLDSGLARVEVDGTFGPVAPLPGVPTGVRGIGWTSGDETLYLSAGGAVLACPFDLATGDVGPPREIGVPDPGGTAVPAGFAVDVAGCVWVAVRGAGRLHRYTPEGRLDTTVELPVSLVTDCTFAGPGSRVLYVTSATEGLDPRERRRELLAGNIFAVDVGIAGVASRPFGPAGDRTAT